MNKTNQKPATIDERYRTLFILWAGLTMSLGLYLAFIQFVPVAAKPNARLTLLLNTAGLIPVGASFLIKQALIGKAIQSQRVEQVHSAYIISWALCEVAGLLGLFEIGPLVPAITSSDLPSLEWECWPTFRESNRC